MADRNLVIGNWFKVLVRVRYKLVPGKSKKEERNRYRWSEEVVLYLKSERK